MVYHGVSNGCGMCKRRRKKCDETRPACTNCIRNKLVCPGYKAKTELVFRSYQPASTCDPPKLAPIPPFDSIYFIPELFDSAIKEQALASFYSEWTVQSSNHEVSRGYLDGLSALVSHAGTTSDLALAVRMMAFHTLGRRKKQPWLIEKASALYPGVLRSFAATIADKKASRSIEALLVCVLLGFYEMFVASAEPGSDLSLHGAHATGVIGILRTGNSAHEVLKSGQANKFVRSLRFYGAVTTNYHANPLDAPLGSSQSDFVGIDVLSPRTWELLLKVETSLANPRATTNEFYQLLGEALEIRELYDRWPKTQLPQWKPKVIGRMGSSCAKARHPLCYPGNVETYFDLYVASMYSTYRKGRMLQYLMIYHLATHLYETRLAEEAQAEAILAAEGLISALPYLLLKDARALVDDADPALKPVPGKAIGGMMIMHLLFVASTFVNDLGENLTSYMKRVLEWIGTDMGIGQGSVLARASKLSVSRRYLSDAHIIVWAGMILQPCKTAETSDEF
ncbi:MAG: hypothetical protein M1820_003223 [Bogoriella megaspora]|nr:MAG: hypothetical protein M1820_003223 [Bogoriella megaspora]